MPGRVHVEAVHGTQALQPDLLQGRRELSSRVVDEEIHRTEPLIDHIEEGLDLIGLPHVTDHGEHISAGGLQLGARVLEWLRPPAADRDTGAGPGQLAGRRSADPGSTAGHDRDPAGIGVICERGSELIYHARRV